MVSTRIPRKSKFSKDSREYTFSTLTHFLRSFLEGLNTWIFYWNDEILVLALNKYLICNKLHKTDTFFTECFFRWWFSLMKRKSMSGRCLVPLNKNISVQRIILTFWYLWENYKANCTLYNVFYINSESRKDRCTLC